MADHCAEVLCKRRNMVCSALIVDILVYELQEIYSSMLSKLILTTATRETRRALPQRQSQARLVSIRRM